MDMGLVIKFEYMAKDSLLFKGKPAVDDTNFVYLPKMATTSKELIDCLLAFRFREGVKFQVNQIYACASC